MPILGAHMSIAGGYYRAVELAAAAGCDCVQLFTKNNNQWRAKPISEEDVAQFQAALRELKISHPLSHSSYLINLAAPDKALRRQSIQAMAVELQRADQLGIRYVVLHPGSFTTSSEPDGIRAVAQSLDSVYEERGDGQSEILLETTAGQGSNLGWRFEQLREIIDRAECGKRVHVCLDTCHMHAAGYGMATAEEFEATIGELDRVVGLTRVKAIHLNDSKTPPGSRKDRHEHIGRGTLGLRPFWFVLHDARLNQLPMYLETPKETLDGEEADQVNLAVLRKLAKAKRVPRA